MIHDQELTMDQLYDKLIRSVEVNGSPAGPRGQNCIEVRPYNFTVTRPNYGLYRGMTRRLNYRFFAVETLMYMAGWGGSRQHTELLKASNANVAAFINNETGLFDGIYGTRLYKSLPAVCDLLMKDPDSRQAVCSIWSPGIPQNSKDVPCTLSLHFFKNVRSEEAGYKPSLDLMVTMRSNDLNWGVPYDVAAFCSIQCAMAGCLNWDVGMYHHVAGSLHLYKDKMPKYTPYDEESFYPEMRLPVPQFGRRMSWLNFQSVCQCYLWELYYHVIDREQPWDTFISTLEKDLSVQTSHTIAYENYFQWWSKMIRFKHSARG